VRAIEAQHVPATEEQQRETIQVLQSEA
jgi:hypothetical protein